MGPEAEVLKHVVAIRNAARSQPYLWNGFIVRAVLPRKFNGVYGKPNTKFFPALAGKCTCDLLHVLARDFSVRAAPILRLARWSTCQQAIARSD
jgi:hypothetical protein